MWALIIILVGWHNDVQASGKKVFIFIIQTRYYLLFIEIDGRFVCLLILSINSI